VGNLSFLPGGCIVGGIVDKAINIAPSSLREWRCSPKPLVAAKGLRRVRSFAVDDDPRIEEAQPLYEPHLTMPDGKAHDVLFVASMGNDIWAHWSDLSDRKRC
jgi:hypothetical protein